MKKLVEIRWHGRGGQGVKTASEFIAAIAIRAGKYAQGFPEYGPERSGAPMKGFTRISGSQIRQHCAITRPDVVMVLDETLIGPVDVCEGLEDDGVLILNTRESASSKLPESCRGAKWALDATGIAIDEIGRPIPNMPMVGALAKITGLLDLDLVLREVREEFSKKFDEKTLQGNLRAIERAYNEVTQDG